jgi:predicted cupin superfamily sugar epimerase
MAASLIIHDDVLKLASQMGLQPHPEGGFYRRTYESNVNASLIGGVWPEGTRRRAATSIKFLLPTGGRSSIHRLLSDELWFWHSGSPITIVELTPMGPRYTVLGDGEFTHMVSAGTSFGCFVPSQASGTAALVSCVVVPGFDFADWTMPTREVLLREFPAPACAAVIDVLSCDGVGPVPARCFL